MKLFLKYLRQNRLRIIAAAVFCLIFIISFALYHLPIEAVVYPAALCLLLGIIFMLFELRRLNKKHERLESIRSLTDVISGLLPDENGIDDEDYQRIIKLISREHTAYRSEQKRRYSDMTDYYTTWAHQIKTPIASMRLKLQNEDSPLSRKLSGDLMRIEQYVEMVLTFLRLDSESTDYVIQEYELDPIVRQAVRKFAGEFIERRLTLEYEPLDISVVSDEKWLSFVIEQVLSNALKYTDTGSICVYMEPEKKLCIRDTGMGIAPEDLPRIFENGFTGYNGRLDKHASGIGLYLCRRICDKLGHDINVESAVGEGTKVTIDLEQKKLLTE